jgi:hypothetical protein
MRQLTPDEVRALGCRHFRKERTGMVTKRKTAAPATPKPKSPGRVARKTVAAAKSGDTLATVTAERDALRKEVAQLHERINGLAGIRAELETRLNAAMAAVQKIIGSRGERA